MATKAYAARKREKLERIAADPETSESVRESVEAQLRAMEGKKSGKGKSTRSSGPAARADSE